MARLRRFFSRLEEGVVVQGGRVLVAVFILGLWEIGSYTFMDPFFFSRPSLVAYHLVKEVFDASLYRDFYFSGLETAIGYIVGCAGGVISGVILARWQAIARIFEPFLIAFNSIPRIALAPLLIMWFGIDIESKIVLAATLVFFLTLFNTFSGIRSVDVGHCNIARIMGASNRQIFTMVMLPSASSWIITGLKISLPFALIGSIIGEFMAASKGLGYRLNMYTSTYNTTGAITILVIMMVVMMVLSELMNRFEARILRWRPPSNMGKEPTEIH